MSHFPNLGPKGVPTSMRLEVVELSENPPCHLLEIPPPAHGFGRHGPIVVYIGQCRRHPHHLIEVGAIWGPKYGELRIGCPRRYCGGVVYPAPEEVMTVVRLLGVEGAARSYLESRHG